VISDQWEYRYRAARSDKPRSTGDDGDTILMLLDQGLNGRAEEPLRLAGVFAPERRQHGGAEAAFFTDELFGEVEERFRAARRRWPFIVVTEMMTSKVEATEARSFARYAAHVWARDTGEYLNQQIADFLASHPEWGHGTGAKAARDNG
jgi:endonuclease YncB( thermonuclease family)